MENSILKDAICEIERLKGAECTIREIGGHNYLISDDAYKEIVPDKFSLPSRFDFTSLDGLVQTLKAEIGEIPDKTHTLGTVYVNVETPKRVSVYSGLDEFNRRAVLYQANCPRDGWQQTENWLEHERAMIALQSQFESNEGTAYLLDFLSRVTDENSVSSDDNGVTQTVQVKKGISLAGREQIRPIVSLRPYRTFLEVEQPESAFLIRIKDGCRIGIIEADGGMWQFEARRRIKAYLEESLSELAEAGTVIVAM